MGKRITREDAGLPDKNCRDPHKPGGKPGATTERDQNGTPAKRRAESQNPQPLSRRLRHAADFHEPRGCRGLNNRSLKMRCTSRGLDAKGKPFYSLPGFSGGLWPVTSTPLPPQFSQSVSLPAFFPEGIVVFPVPLHLGHVFEGVIYFTSRVSNSKR